MSVDYQLRLEFTDDLSKLISAVFHFGGRIMHRYDDPLIAVFPAASMTCAAAAALA